MFDAILQGAGVGYAPERAPMTAGMNKVPESREREEITNKRKEVSGRKLLTLEKPKAKTT